MPHGGKRDGAGRKPDPVDGKRRNVSITLPQTVITFVDAERGGRSRAAFVESAIRGLMPRMRTTKRSAK